MVVERKAPASTAIEFDSGQTGVQTSVTRAPQTTVAERGGCVLLNFCLKKRVMSLGGIDVSVGRRVRWLGKLGKT